ncbi:MAG TPA: hypothetical protein IAB94_02305 [Candidatus Coproplasma avicola]|uniref:Uncharacterized protein n=1 Tax=Candidatus Coproplasma avicola TaxID=2840744 RepID=A0A9D1E605_9FIRM|nr:hypothetical protein [Candidatus Coproplasma avicola]
MKNEYKFGQFIKISRAVLLTVCWIDVIAVWVLTFVYRSDQSKTVMIVSVCVGLLVFAITSLCVLEAIRSRFVDKNYGKVSKTDRQMAKALLFELSDIMICGYDFVKLDENDVRIIKDSLRIIARGHKVCKESVGKYLELTELINNSDKRDLPVNEKFNAYVINYVELVKNNLSDV